jgi:hypothetical protein
VRSAVRVDPGLKGPCYRVGVGHVRKTEIRCNNVWVGLKSLASALAQPLAFCSIFRSSVDRRYPTATAFGKGLVLQDYLRYICTWYYYYPRSRTYDDYLPPKESIISNTHAHIQSGVLYRPHFPQPHTIIQTSITHHFCCNGLSLCGKPRRGSHYPSPPQRLLRRHPCRGKPQEVDISIIRRLDAPFWKRLAIQPNH